MTTPVRRTLLLIALLSVSTFLAATPAPAVLALIGLAASGEILERTTPINISQRAANQTEPTIAVNPADPRQIAAFSNDAASVPGLFVAVSGDGGATWAGRSLFSSGSSAACCDAQAAFDQHGNLFLTYLGNNRNVYVAVSSDGGQTFGTPIALTTSGQADQPSVATGPSGLGSSSVWVSYAEGDGIVARAAIVNGRGLVGAFGPAQNAPGGRGAYGDVDIGPAGQVLVTYQTESADPAGPSQLFVHLDPDGAGPALFGAPVLVTQTQVGVARSIPATSNNFGVDAEVNLAWDRSGGAYTGRVYMVYLDAPSTISDDLDVFVRYSDNNGAAWSAPVRINDDDGGASQFMPAIAVDQTTGRVGVDWYDARSSERQREAQLYAAVGTPGGVLWSANGRIAPALSLAAAADTGFSPFRPLGYGDYITVDFHDGALYAVWADNSATLPNIVDSPRLDLAFSKVNVHAPQQYQQYFPLLVEPAFP